MRLVFLATGWGGVPSIGSPREARIPRRGSSDLVIQPDYPNGPTILVDASMHLWYHWMNWPDAPARPDAVILTHSHYDHMAGLLDLRGLDPPLPVYGTPATFADFAQFSAATMGNSPFFPPVFDLRPLPETGPFTVCDVTFEALPVHHLIPVTGLLVRHGGKVVATLSDTVAEVEQSVREAIRGCDALVVHAPEVEDSHMHIGVTGAIALAREVEAKRLLLTHLGVEITPEVVATLQREYPWVTVPQDGATVAL